MRKIIKLAIIINYSIGKDLILKRVIISLITVSSPSLKE